MSDKKAISELAHKVADEWWNTAYPSHSHARVALYKFFESAIQDALGSYPELSRTCKIHGTPLNGSGDCLLCQHSEANPEHQWQKERLALALCAREAWNSNAGLDGQRLRNIIRHIEEAIGTAQLQEIVKTFTCKTCGAADHCTYEHVNEVSS